MNPVSKILGHYRQVLEKGYEHLSVKNDVRDARPVLAALFVAEIGDV